MYTQTCRRRIKAMYTNTTHMKTGAQAQPDARTFTYLQYIHRYSISSVMKQTCRYPSTPTHAATHVHTHYMGRKHTTHMLVWVHRHTEYIHTMSVTAH